MHPKLPTRASYLGVCLLAVGLRAKLAEYIALPPAPRAVAVAGFVGRSRG